MTHRSVIVAAAGAALAASAANAQFFDIEVDQAVIDLNNGANQVVNFSLYLDIGGQTTGIDVGGGNVVDFFGWAGYEGSFALNGVGSFVANQETGDDAQGGTEQTAFGEAIYPTVGWFGRAPGALAEDGSIGVLGPSSVAPGTPVSGSSAAGSDGSFRFAAGGDPVYAVSMDGKSLFNANGQLGSIVFSGAQAPTAVGGENQNTDGRVEVFRGQVSFAYTEGDINSFVAMLGSADIDFAGTGNIFIDSALNNIAGGLGIDNSGGLIQVVPAPSAVAMLGLGGLIAGRRRR